MKRLWAPWRITYILNVDARDECIFCTRPQGEPSEENLVLYKGKHNFIIMNLFPYNTGHLMVAPYRHIRNLEDMTPQEHQEMMELVTLSIRALKEAYKPDGFNIGMNLGRVAGAGIDDHLHMHVVPRWNGDTNFMPVTGYTKVIPEGVRETYRKLREVLEKLV